MIKSSKQNMYAIIYLIWTISGCGSNDQNTKQTTEYNESQQEVAIDMECFSSCMTKIDDSEICRSLCKSSEINQPVEGKEEHRKLSISEIMVNGVVREYHSYIPENHPTESKALLIAIHGGGETDYYFPQADQFEALAQREGVIIIYPHAKLASTNEGAWQLNTRSDTRQDLDFIEALIDEFSSTYMIDESRVYATGYSLGSMFTYELACHLSARFASIASYAGSMPVDLDSCDQTRNVPILHIHGAQDSIIPYATTWDWKRWDSVGTMRDIPSLIQFWKEKYNCQDEQRTEVANAAHITYAQCEQDARVEHYRLNDVDHEWPSEIFGSPTHQVIWSFLSEFSIE